MTAPAVPDDLVAPGRVVVLVGAAGSGKTTVREAVVAAGLAPERVVSLDDLRVHARERDALAGREPRPLQTYSYVAVLAAAAQQERLLAAGTGYLVDATHLRRRERVAHVRAAASAGLPAVAVLLPALPVQVLHERVLRRPPERHVPVDVLARQAHRRSLLHVDSVAEEGFAAVYVADPANLGDSEWFTRYVGRT